MVVLLMSCPSGQLSTRDRGSGDQSFPKLDADCPKETGPGKDLASISGAVDIGIADKTRRVVQMGSKS